MINILRLALSEKKLLKKKDFEIVRMVEFSDFCTKEEFVMTEDDYKLVESEHPIGEIRRFAMSGREWNKIMTNDGYDDLGDYTDEECPECSHLLVSLRDNDSSGLERFCSNNECHYMNEESRLFFDGKVERKRPVLKLVD